MLFRPKSLKSFQRILGQHKVLVSEEDLLSYSYDTTAERVIPQMVVLVESTEDVQAVVDFALDEGLIITPRGAGTGMSGGSVPLKRGIVISTERMAFIYQVDPEARTMLVGSGITTVAVQNEAAKHGLFYPPDPSSYKASTIGGNVAENAGGLRCVKYGTTKHYVLGLEFVNAHAEVLRTGALDEGESPFDLTPLLVGSEGTLGVITTILLRLIEAPAARGTLRLLFPSLEEAAGASAEIMAAGVVPSVAEIMDKAVLEAVTAFTGTRLPAEAQALLLIEVDGPAEAVEAGMAQVEHICRTRRALEIQSTRNPVEAEQLWTLRRSVSPSLARLARGKLNEDVSVPRSQLPDLIAAAQRISRRYGLLIPCFGHVGDGNIHVNVMFNPDDTLERKRALQAVEEIYKETVALGGSISGEHGIGYVKRDYLRLQMSQSEIDTLRRIKQAFDPDGIFNPGKIIPD
ncbi:MAG: FAD-binding protein [Candidatus Zixiibacteriota bacterium]|nr:MAG: FAD-binding protein [candidate division Zixibacteria bacterium]